MYYPNHPYKKILFCCKLFKVLIYNVLISGVQQSDSVICIYNKLWEILKEMGIPDHLTCLLETYMQVRKQQLELDMEQQTDSKKEKEYVKAVYCHPAYLTSM